MTGTAENANYRGPLAGLRVVEFAGIGPAPFTGMLLRQLGAEVLRIDRPPVNGHQLLPMDEKFDFLNRDKPVLTLDLKDPEHIELAKEVIAAADILIEGFRPGVMERLGLGPQDCLSVNPALIFGRVTGWGQNGPLAQHAGHDINYIALTGALNAIGEQNRAPVPPLNLVGDFAGGALYLVVGILAALNELQKTARGQVIDAAMVDGATHLMTFIQGLRQAGLWSLERGSNQPDGGFPFNAVYECSDGQYLVVAAAEMAFRLNFLARIGLPEEVAKQGDNPRNWPEIKNKIAEILIARPRDEWAALLDDNNTCVAPVLNMDEASSHPHNVERELYQKQPDGTLVPAVAPKFSNGTPTPEQCTAEELLDRWSKRKTDV